MATELIDIDAARAGRGAAALADGVFAEFGVRFPGRGDRRSGARHRRRLEDLGSGGPVDRLMCGDVGFGKTEVAVRAAYYA